ETVVHNGVFAVSQATFMTTYHTFIVRTPSKGKNQIIQINSEYSDSNNSSKLYLRKLPERVLQTIDLAYMLNSQRPCSRIVRCSDINKEGI
ncbi:MAG: hypothetical protein MK066_10575, partial [Crocinitomicaceae bacterium]|nr:hypothetical protein [Crocinitomicaceae bacterium]